MTTHTTQVTKSDEKKNSIVFKPSTTTENPIITSVYLMRPMANGHTKAEITVKFLD